MFQKPSPDIALARREDMTFTHSPDAVETIVGPSMNVEGDFVSEGNIVIKGTVMGSIKTNQTVFVEEGAKVIADVKAVAATISGQVRGNIRVNDKVEITASAQIVGDIHCRTLVVQAGALLQGKINMPGIQIDSPKPEKKKFSFRSKTGVDESNTDSEPQVE